MFRSSLRGAVVFDKDPIRAALFAPHHIAYSTEQDDVCQSIMLAATEYMLNTDRRQHVILDGRTFSRQYQIASLDNFAVRHNIPLHIIQCVCSDAVAQQRLAQDVASGTHLARNRDFPLYLAIKARFEAIRDPKLSIQTTTWARVAQALAYLRQPGFVDGVADGPFRDQNRSE